jgi:hypothetical protein
MNTHGEAGEEVNIKIGKAAMYISRLSNIWTSMTILKTKIKQYKSNIKSSRDMEDQQLYGEQTETVRRC